jgi:hypothetical protein
MMKTLRYFLLIATIGTTSRFAQSALPENVIPFQGQLADQAGQPLSPSNAVTVVFRLYRVPVGGVAIWEESQPNILVNASRFSVLLGSRAELPGPTNFNATLYLGLTIDDGNPATADVEMRPRQALVPVISATYAKEAAKLNGYDWTAIFGTNNPVTGTFLDSKIRDGSIGGAKLQPSTITAGQIASKAVSTAQIADNAVTSDQIADSTLTAAKLSAQLVLDALIPPGTISAFGGANVPDGWLLCNGKAYPRIGSTARLFNAIQFAWGDGDGVSTFNVPDLQGLFLRGRDGSANRDPTKDTRTPSAHGGNGGNLVGSIQPDELKAHKMKYSYAGIATPVRNDSTGVNVLLHGSSALGAPNAGSDGRGQIGNRYAQNDNQGSIYYDSNDDTHPKNAYVNYIIKY